MTTVTQQNELDLQLQKLLEKWRTGTVPGVILQVELPNQKFEWAGASGQFAFDQHRPLTATDPFRIASVTKTITAATVLRLAEQGHLKLDEPISRYLPASLLNGLHILNGVSYIEAVTLRHLLSHTSGLYDYITDDTFSATLASNPERAWLPVELIEQARQLGKPYFEPGQGFFYSDTGFVLAGLIIEVVSGQPLQQVYRQQIFEPLKMADTYLEGYDQPRSGEVSHAYLEQLDLSWLNPTYDWAGGGLVSSASDLSQFMRGLLEGGLLKPESLAAMQQWRSLRDWQTDSVHYHDYGLGLGRNEIAGEKIVGHTGAFGAFIYYWPRQKATLTGTFNSFAIDRPAFLAEIIALVKDGHDDTHR